MDKKTKKQIMEDYKKEIANMHKPMLFDEWDKQMTKLKVIFGNIKNKKEGKINEGNSTKTSSGCRFV